MIVSHDVDGPEQGPAVVLLHSAVCDRRMWDPQWAPLVEAGFRVVRADFRTCGRTPAGTGRYSDDGDVLALMDALGLSRAALVGSSYGGRVALRIAATQPQRVTALALLCAGRPGREPGPELRAFDEAESALLEAGDLDAAAALNARTWLGPEAEAEVRAAVTRMQRDNFANWYGPRPEPTGTVREDGPEEATGAEGGGSDEAGGAGDGGGEGVEELPEPDLDLRSVTAPTLAVGGAHDVPDFRAVAGELAGLIPDARHLELPWAGHLPSLERPDEVTALLVDFLRASRSEREPAAG